MIPPIPTSIKDFLFLGFLQAIRQKLDRSVSLDKYTTAERDLITNWKVGEMIFNIDLDSAQVKTSTGWATI